MGEEVYDQLDGGKFPSVTFASRSVRNIVYDKKLQQFILGQNMVKRFSGNIKHIRPFTQLLWLAYFSKKLVDEKRTSTLRDVFYSAQAFDVEFMDQAESDELITDLEVLLELAREDFNVYPEERSAIFGNMTVEYTTRGYEGRRLDLSSHPDGVMIGPALTTAEFVDTEAEIVLAIEKGGLFTRFIEEKVQERFKAILVNTAGQPPRSTRYLLRRLNHELHLPVGILCDADPWGAHIAMVIKSGSAGAAHLRELTTPTAKWLGVWASITEDEPVIVERNGFIRNEKIGELYDSVMKEKGATGDVLYAPTRLNAVCSSASGTVGVMPVSALMRHKYDGDIYQIRTAGGYTVKTTGNHSIEVFNPHIFSLEPVRVDSISEGDLAAACFTLPNNQQAVEINLAKMISEEAPELANNVFVEGEQAKEFASSLKSRYSKKVLRERFYQVLKRDAVKLSYFFAAGSMPTSGCMRLRYSKNKIPVVIKDMKEFARLMGYHVAEGGPSQGRRGSCCELTFNIDETEYIVDATKCIRDTLGINARSERRSHAIRIRYGGSLLAKVLTDVLRAGDGARDKQVPFAFFNAPDAVKVEFLKGCFRGDRMINYHEGTRLALKTVSRKLASDLVVLLRQLNCVAYAWRSGKSYVVSCAETSQISEVVEELCHAPVEVKSEILSMPGSLVYSMRNEMKQLVSQGKRTTMHRLLFSGGATTRVGYNRLRTAFNMFEKPVEDPKLRTLVWLVNNNVVLLPIKEIKNLGSSERYVYDLEVEDVHTFVGGLGGLVLHNSDIIKYKLPSDPLTEIDIKRLYELKADPRYTEKMWHQELDTFLKIKKKSEQEAFSRYGLSYIVDKYLPEKLEMMKSM